MLCHGWRAEGEWDLRRGQGPYLHFGLPVQERKDVLIAARFKHNERVDGLQERVLERNRGGDRSVDLCHNGHLPSFAGWEADALRFVNPLPDNRMLEDNLRLFLDSEAGRTVVDGDHGALQWRQGNALLQHSEVDLVGGAVLEHDLLSRRIVNLHCRLHRPAKLTFHRCQLFRRRRLRNELQVVPELAHDIVEEHCGAFAPRWQQRTVHKLVRCCLLRRQDKLHLAEQPVAVEGHLEDDDVVEGVHQLDVHCDGLAHHARQRQHLLRLRGQRHELDGVPGEVPGSDVAEHDAARDLPGLQRLEHELVLHGAAALHLRVRGAGDVHEVALHLEGRGRGGVVPDEEGVGGLLPGLALDDHVLVREGLLGDAAELVLVRLVGARVVQDQLGLDVADPLGLEGQGVVGHCRLAVGLPLLGGELPGPVKLGHVLGEAGLDGPLPLRGVDDGDLLRHMLPRLRVEVQGAVRVRGGGHALDLVHADVHVGGQRHLAGVDARLLRPELEAQLGHAARSHRGRLPRLGRRPSVDSGRAGSGVHLRVGLPVHIAGLPHAIHVRDLLRRGVVGRGELHVVDDGVREHLLGAGTPVLQPHPGPVHLDVAVGQDELLVAQLLRLHR
mmetsp:Transcript_85346/g.249831  ORF Transcript_85346/g.249831 Transcript_85346/m.249831 type:complete len:613 (-) Transcript_85346:1080-2918(-)